MKVYQLWLGKLKCYDTETNETIYEITERGKQYLAAVSELLVLSK